MTLHQINELFEKIKTEQSVVNLFEYKVSVTSELGNLHRKLHSGQHDRSEILQIINTVQSLLDFISERINQVKQDDFDNRKQKRIEQASQSQGDRRQRKRQNLEHNNFILAAKNILDKKTYDKIWTIARNVTPKSEGSKDSY